MREIEVKARLTDKEAVLSALERTGVSLSEPLTQRDIVWLEKNSEPTNYVGRNALRIRIENDTRSIFTLKRTLATMDKIEHETEITDAKEMRAAIEMLDGFELFNDLTKTRRKASFEGYEICLDDIEGLGSFIEIEKLCDDDVDGEAVRAEMWDMLERFGAERAYEVTKGYDILMHEKEGEQ